MIAIDKQYFKNWKFIDLFAGLGGFRLALESLGAKCVYSSEWNIPVQKVYYDNFGDIPEGDITKIDEKTIPDHDILCAGFPCQAFSISGKQKGFEDNRGTLFFDVARIVKEKRPKIVFMENVKNFATHDKGKTLEIVKSTMEELGYVFKQKVLNAVDYGVPQKRERIYMVCFRKDINTNSFVFPKPIKLTKHVEDFLLDDIALTESLYVNRPDTYYNSTEDTIYSNKPIRLGIVNKGGQGERIYSTKGIAITLSAYGGGVFAKTGGYLVNGRPRKLHPRECARLMGYPDTYKISKITNQAYQQLGNSVVIDVLQYIGIEMGKALEGKVSMRPGEQFETCCYHHLNTFYAKNGTTFQHEGGMDSTKSDIAVIKNGKIDFYIEAKDALAQSGQFVLQPDENRKVFVFSPRNHSTRNGMTNTIIAYMNNDFERFNNAGTAGQSLDIDTGVFADWIIEHYRSKNVKYVISCGREYVIFPIRKFEQYFDISANYRIKKSGSSAPAKKDVFALEHFIKESYTTAAFSNEGTKLFVHIAGGLHKDKFVLGNYTYYLSERTPGQYEVRKLSNTYNMNVIFSIKLKKEQNKNDLEEFKADISM